MLLFTVEVRQYRSFTGLSFDTADTCLGRPSVTMDHTSYSTDKYYKDNYTSCQTENRPAIRIVKYDLIIRIIRDMIRAWVPPIEAAASEKMVDGQPSGHVPFFTGYWKGGMRMLTMEGLIAVISLCVGCFSLGYVLGRKNDR